MAFDPAAHYPIVLRHGVPALLRPLCPDDRDAIQAAFERLSPESAYLRFWSRIRELNPRFIETLLSPVETRQATWVIVLPDSDDLPGVGGGSFWRSPEDPTLAEVSFTVADEFQNQGIGTVLLAALWAHARSLGIRQFEAHVLDTNLVMRGWWDALGASATRMERGWRLLLSLEEGQLDPSSATRSLRHWLKRLES